MPYWDLNKTHTGFRKLSLQRQLYILIIPRLNVHQPPDKEWSLTTLFRQLFLQPFQIACEELHFSISFVFVFPLCFFAY